MLQTKEVEAMKRFMTESNSIVLYIILAIALSHFVFLFLRYKNDISFWRNRNDFEGLSVQAIKVNKKNGGKIMCLD